jgi:4-hydroxybenzoyl-CoA reductase subunit alpha
MAGNAVKAAAEDINSRLYRVAARELGCEPDALVSEGRRIFIETAPHVGMDFAEAARLCFSANGPLVGTGCYEPPSGLGGDFKGATVGTSPAFSFGSSVCELEVDPETGVVRIIKFTDAHDSGTVINPVAFHGQVEGSIVMGLGEVLSEDMVFDDEGRILNPNLHDYLIPSIDRVDRGAELRAAGPLRRQGGGGGLDGAGARLDRQRHLRCDRRAHDRASDYAAEDPQSAQGAARERGVGGT